MLVQKSPLRRYSVTGSTAEEARAKYRLLWGDTHRNPVPL